MTSAQILALLERVAAGEASPAEALDRMAWLPIEEVFSPNNQDASFARLDHHRALRVGQPEVVYCPGKTVDQVVSICERFVQRGDGFLATRADDEIRDALAAAFPGATINVAGRIVHVPGVEQASADSDGALIVVATGGTADEPVAEEAAVTARAFGHRIEQLYDVGVAGLHRVLRSSDVLRRATVVIAVAGMEGALPSVIAGLVAAPVVAVPTSAGYGASFGGIAALLAMLNSCVPGLTVVNIDNGFGAACAADRVCRAAVRAS